MNPSNLFLFILCIIGFSIPDFSRAQSDSVQNENKLFQVNYLGLNAELVKFETFAGITAGGNYQRWNYDLSLQTSLGQLYLSRLLPRFQISAGYFLMNKNAIKLGPVLRFAVSTYNYGNVKESRGVNSEWLFGYKLHAGKGRLSFVHSASGGMISTGYYSALYNKWNYGSNFTYSFLIALVYAI